MNPKILLRGEAPVAPRTTELLETMCGLAGPGAWFEQCGDHYRIAAKTADDMLPGLNYKRQGDVYYCNLYPSDISLIEADLRELEQGES